MFLTQHLIAVKDAVKGVSFYWSFSEFTGGANLTCSILSSYLATIENLANKTVFMQMDNCGGENKNWQFVQYCNVLVAMGRVKAIVLNFLPVGHTHIDIDQVCISLFVPVSVMCSRHAFVL